MLGAARAFTDVPFFWTHHQGVELRCSGYMAGCDEVGIDGDVHARDFTARYYRAGRLLAASSVGRDLETLSIEAVPQACISGRGYSPGTPGTKSRRGRAPYSRRWSALRRGSAICLCRSTSASAL